MDSVLREIVIMCSSHRCPRYVLLKFLRFLASFADSEETRAWQDLARHARNDYLRHRREKLKDMTTHEAASILQRMWRGIKTRKLMRVVSRISKQNQRWHENRSKGIGENIEKHHWCQQLFGFLTKGASLPEEEFDDFISSAPVHMTIETDLKSIFDRAYGKGATPAVEEFGKFATAFLETVYRSLDPVNLGYIHPDEATWLCIMVMGFRDKQKLETMKTWLVDSEGRVNKFHVLAFLKKYWLTTLHRKECTHDELQHRAFLGTLGGLIAVTEISRLAPRQAQAYTRRRERSRKEPRGNIPMDNTLRSKISQMNHDMEVTRYVMRTLKEAGEEYDKKRFLKDPWKIGSKRHVGRNRLNHRKKSTKHASQMAASMLKETDFVSETRASSWENLVNKTVGLESARRSQKLDSSLSRPTNSKPKATGSKSKPSSPSMSARHAKGRRMHCSNPSLTARSVYKRTQAKRNSQQVQLKSRSKKKPSPRIHSSRTGQLESFRKVTKKLGLRPEDIKTIVWRVTKEKGKKFGSCSDRKGKSGFAESPRSDTSRSVPTFHTQPAVKGHRSPSRGESGGEELKLNLDKVAMQMMQQMFGMGHLKSSRRENLSHLHNLSTPRRVHKPEPSKEDIHRQILQKTIDTAHTIKPLSPAFEQRRREAIKHKEMKLAARTGDTEYSFAPVVNQTSHKIVLVQGKSLTERLDERIRHFVEKRTHPVAPTSPEVRKFQANQEMNQKVVAGKSFVDRVDEDMKSRQRHRMQLQKQEFETYQFMPELNASSLDMIKKPFHDRLEKDNKLREKKRMEMTSRGSEYPHEPQLVAKSPKNIQFGSFHVAIQPHSCLIIYLYTEASVTHMISVVSESDERRLGEETGE
mmetsp:Transcript_4648/g.9047  ORF Transcript_4648/g.9047 Transcript_4648/m.9047 type:complete len:864 (-) Transcript_4648:215-2806(-)